MKHTRILRALGLVLVLASSAHAQVTERVSVNAAGVQGNDHSTSPSISADGRSVAFHSDASNLVGFDTNGVLDIYYRAWLNDYTEFVSADTSEVLGNSTSQSPSISADGIYVAFASTATNLVPGDTNGKSDIILRNRSAGTTLRASVSSSGIQGNGDSFTPSTSADGRYVAFMSFATNLVPGDSNGFTDIFLRDRLTGVTERVSVSAAGVEGNNSSTDPSISADGRFVAFASSATNLVPGDTNNVKDVFLRDRLNGATVRLSVSGAGVEANGGSSYPSISADGLSVAFLSDANLVGWDTNGVPDVYYRAWQNSYTELVSADSNEVLGNGRCERPSISADGRYVAFASEATNLAPGDTNGKLDVFVRARSIGTTERVSLSSGGVQGTNPSFSPSISADARYVAFTSSANNLVPGDTNGKLDVFLHDRDARGFTSLCGPGVDGVLACPCSNPPSGSGRGCNNSAATGGAFLTASGIAYLSMDSLVFTTFGEKPTALSIVLQGNALASSGLVYGQGVRCVGGTLKRLFTKTASAGSISAPDFGAGDPTVSARSAAKGDPIQPGQSRWYLVYYRDGQILGGCPSTSTFNATQTGRVTWMQ
ncbi:MAG: TolB family protein [Planctomycetota bacterium]